MSDRTISGKAAIVGIGATEFSKKSGRSEMRLAVEAVLPHAQMQVSRLLRSMALAPIRWTITRKWKCTA